MEIKVGDVFKFRWNNEWYKKRFDPYWCFDGQLIAKEENGKIVLVDTYWPHDSRTFTIEEALTKGTLAFICNLDDVTTVGDDVYYYYDDADIFDLSYQHNCYKNIKLRKGTERSKNKMLQTVNERMEDAKRKVQYFKDMMIRLQSIRNEISSGITNLYIPYL